MPSQPGRQRPVSRTQTRDQAPTVLDHSSGPACVLAICRIRPCRVAPSAIYSKPGSARRSARIWSDVWATILPETTPPANAYPVGKITYAPGGELGWAPWDNMTIACSECNRRKLDHYDPECVFLDSNVDDVLVGEW